jgi:hypothetical protein
MSSSQKQLKLEIPDADWVPGYFKSISARASRAELDDLKARVMDENDMEIRIWYGFGVSELGGYIIKRKAGIWSGFWIPADGSNDEFGKLVSLNPNSGWESLWARLTKEGLLTLTDASTLSGYDVRLDGTSYVVEINMDQTYRTYMYQDPEYRKQREAVQMVQIMRTIALELGPRITSKPDLK